METLRTILIFVAPIAAGFITSVFIPFLIKRFALKKLEKKIEEVNEAKEFKEINKKLEYLITEIDLLRGKRR